MLISLRKKYVYNMNKRILKRFIIVTILVVLHVLLASCNKSNVDIVNVSELKIKTISTENVYMMFYCPESLASEIEKTYKNTSQVDYAIINKMLKYKEEGYVGITATASPVNDYEAVFDISNINSYRFKVLIYINDYNTHIITHELQYYLEHEEYDDLIKDGQFTIDISYYLYHEFGETYYHEDQDYYIYREFPNYFSYIMSLDKGFLMKCILGFLFRVLAGVIIAVLFGIVFFRNKKILIHIFIINLILQTIADCFVFTNNDWGFEFFLIMPVTIIFMIVIEIVVLLKSKKHDGEINHYMGKVYLFSIVSNIIAFICNGMLYNVLPHLDW